MNGSYPPPDPNSPHPGVPEGPGAQGPYAQPQNGQPQYGQPQNGQPQGQPTYGQPQGPGPYDQPYPPQNPYGGEHPGYPGAPSYPGPQGYPGQSEMGHAGPAGMELAMPAYAGGPIYRAPAPGQTFAPLGSGLRKAYIGVTSVMMFGFIASIASLVTAIAINPDRPDDTLMGLFIGSLFLVMALLYVQMGIGLFWVYRVWKWLPENQRWTKHWKGPIDPAMAAGMMLIPYFQYYWMFVIDCGICDAMDRLRVLYPTSREAPKSLAIAACICQMIIPLPVGAILWIMFMGRVEQMSRDMATNANRQGGYPSLGPR